MIHQPEIWKSQTDQGYMNTADFQGCSQAACSAAQPELPQPHLFQKPNTVHNTKKKYSSSSLHAKKYILSEL